MTTTSANAIDECAAIMNTLAATAYPAAVLRWRGKEEGDTPTDKDWFRWTMQHADGYQASLSNQHGERRWRREGIIIVQCFSLLTVGGMQKAQRMAESVRDAYQGRSTPGGVWFRNATTQEVGQDRHHYQVNAIVNFNYDEVR